MKVEIRTPNWDNLNDRGIPKDCADVMNYFNKGLEGENYPFVPRRNKITGDEIKNIWVPSRDKNITCVAYSQELEKIVGSGTLVVDDKKFGNYSITIDPEFQFANIGTRITKKVIEEGLMGNITIIVHTSIFNEPMKRVMDKVGYKPNKIIKDFEKYRTIKANSFDVYEYVIKPK